MRLLVWQLVIIALVIGARGWSSKPWWRHRGTRPRLLPLVEAEPV